MKLLKIDIHTHIIPENLPDLRKRYDYGGFISLDHHKAGCAKMIENMGFDDPTKEMLLSGSALNWLGLKKEQFVDPILV